MLVGEYVALRAWQTDDLSALQSMRNNLRLQRQLMTQPRGNSLNQVKDWLTTRTTSQSDVFFVIANKTSDQAVGYIQVVGMDFINGTAKLGICITPEAQGKGYGKEALTLLEGYLSSVFRLRKLTLEVLAGNAQAIGLYKKHNYREVGYFREHFHTGSGYEDVVIMEKKI